jgi:hypothetical protein
MRRRLVFRTFVAISLDGDRVTIEARWIEKAAAG